jgi:predicted RNA-binding protein with PUA-like domain
LLGLAELRESAELADMVILRKGNRLSITPVTEQEWKAVKALLAKR